MKQYYKDCKKKINWLEHLLFNGMCINCNNYREEVGCVY